MKDFKIVLGLSYLLTTANNIFEITERKKNPRFFKIKSLKKTQPSMWL